MSDCGSPSPGNLHFGFLAQSTIARFQSQDYQERIDASQEIIEAVKTASEIEELDIKGLLHFLESYVSDPNYLTAQNIAQIVSEVVNQLEIRGHRSQPYLHQIVKIALLQFDDRRRTVCQLGQTLFIDLLATNDHYEVMNELVRLSSNPPPKVLIEIFRCITNLITQEVLDPTILLQFPFYFDAALLSVHGNVRQSVIWCIDYLKQNHPQVHATLTALLSRDAIGALGCVVNVKTAVSKVRAESIIKNRTVNTAGQVDAAKAKAMPFTRTVPLSRNQYQRPSLPSGKGARQINLIASMSRPVTTSTFPDEELPPNFVRIDEEVPARSRTYHPGLTQTDGDLPGFPDEQPVFSIREEANETETAPQRRSVTFANLEDKPLPRLKDTDDVPRRLLSDGVLAVTKGKARKVHTIQPKQRLITFDAATLPNDDDVMFSSSGGVSRPIPQRAKSDMRHISFAQTTSPSLPQDDQDMPSDRPIKASGFYNIGEGIDFDLSPPPPMPARKKAQLSMTTKRQQTKPKITKVVAAKPARDHKVVLDLPAPSKVQRIPQLIEKLRSSEWSDQNDAITEFMSNTPEFADQIKANLRDIMTSLLECAASLRSALAKNALNCILKFIGIKTIDFEPISDMTAASLLTLVASQKSKHFISELSGQCFASMLNSISANKAADILRNEHKRKHDDAREQVAACMITLADRLPDTSVLLKPLANLVKDKNQEVRKNAKAAISAIKARNVNFAQMVNAALTDETEISTIMDAL